MKFKLTIILALLFATFCMKKTVNLADYGIKPDTEENASPLFRPFFFQQVINATIENNAFDNEFNSVKDE